MLDVVAHTRVKTPTAAAELLIHTVARQAAILDTIGSNIVSAVGEALTTQKNRLRAIVLRLPIATSLLLQQQRHRLDLLQQKCEAHSPKRILALGYSLTTCGGRVVRSVEDIKSGDVIETHLPDGKIISEVK